MVKVQANDAESDPIVIVGAACRLPGEASSMNGLWNMISNGRTAHSKIPKDRFDADAWYHPDPDRKGTVGVLVVTIHTYSNVAAD